MGNSIFQGENYEEALKKGLDQLNLTESEVNIKVIEEKKGSFFKKPLIKLEIVKVAAKEELSRENEINIEDSRDEDQLSKFSLKYTEEGVFLDVYFYTNPSELLPSILEYIKIKEIKNPDINKVKKSVGEESAESIQIAPPQEEVLVDENIQIEFSKDKMQCFITLSMAFGGQSITKEIIKSRLGESGVIYGIVDETISDLLTNRVYNEKILVAEGKKATPGENAKIIYHFDAKATNSPQLLDDGNVDFKQLNLISNVNENDLLAEIIPETEGIKGYDVFGNEVPPRAGKPLNVKKGKNTREDDLKIYASRAGQVTIKDGAITVSEVFEVPGDVDNSTGNIKFNGRIIVKGNVKSGFTLEADGDIIVYGVVEGAKLKANGDIVLNRGVQGNNQAFLECTGNLVAKYIENTSICANGNIEADCILHSYAVAKSKVVISGKRGLIAGGEVKAGDEISAITIGSHMGTSTKLEVGIDPEIKQKLTDLKKEVSELENKLDGLKKTIDLLNRISRTSKLTPEKEEMFVKSIKAYEVLKNRHTTLSLELVEQESSLETSTKGKIHVSRTIYPGVKATILNVTRQLYDELSNCTLTLNDGEVVIGPYEK